MMSTLPLIPLTGTIRGPDGQRFNGMLKLTLSYVACRSTLESQLVVARRVRYPVVNGRLPAGAVITPNDILEPENTSYLAEYFSASGVPVAKHHFYIQGDTFDIGTAQPTPITTANISFMPLPEPTGDADDMMFIQAGGGTIERTVQDRMRDVLSVKDFGAKGDGVRLADVSFTNGSSTLNSASASFTAADVGKRIAVIGGGASFSTLATTIVEVLSPTAIRMAAVAGSSGTNRNARYATDDTAAIDAAITAALRSTAGGYKPSCLAVHFPAGFYGFTTIRIGARLRVCGDGLNTELWRLGAGAGGAAFAMRPGAIAEFLRLHDFTLECNYVGSNLDGIVLGPEIPGTTDVSSGSFFRDLFICNVTGIGMHLVVNVAGIANIWVQNLYIGVYEPPTARAIQFTAGELTVDMLSVEGNFHGGWLQLDCVNCDFNMIQIEVMSTTDTLNDLITVNGTGNVFSNCYAIGTNQRSFFKLTTNANDAEIRNARYSTLLGSSVQYLVDDLAAGGVGNQLPGGSTNSTVYRWSRRSTRLVAEHLARANIAMLADQNGVNEITTYLALGIGGQTTPTNNTAINLQQIVNGLTRKRFIFLNGGLDTTSTAVDPRFASALGTAVGFMSDGATLSLWVAPEGVNQIPNRVWEVDLASVLTIPALGASGIGFRQKNDLGNITIQMHQDAGKHGLFDVNTASGGAGARISANPALPSFVLSNLFGIGTTNPTSNLHVTGLPIFANNAAAVTGGLTAGAFYRTGADPDPVCVVH